MFCFIIPLKRAETKVQSCGSDYICLKIFAQISQQEDTIDFLYRIKFHILNIQSPHPSSLQTLLKMHKNCRDLKSLMGRGELNTCANALAFKKIGNLNGSLPARFKDDQFDEVQGPCCLIAKCQKLANYLIV